MFFKILILKKIRIYFKLLKTSFESFIKIRWIIFEKIGLEGKLVYNIQTYQNASFQKILAPSFLEFLI